MPEQTETRIHIRRDDKEILLIGTAHVSRESVEEAAAAVRQEQPDALCIELDKGRYESLTQKDTWEKLDLIKLIREGKGFLLIANLVLSGFQRRLGNELGVKPGEEMRAAVQAAEEAGIPCKLCDRELHITLRRAWGSCGFWSRMKLMAALLSSAFSTEKLDEQELENLKTKNELDRMMGELTEYLPSVKRTLIDERDSYMAAKIAEAASEENVKRVLAIVGAGHLKGLASRLDVPRLDPAQCKLSVPVDVSELERIPPRSVFSRALAWLIPLAIAGLIAAGFISQGPDAGLGSLVRWLLWNGSLAALGAAAALAHPLAVLAAFIGAPIGTLSPVLSVGMFAGVAQAALRRPRVIDAEQLSADAASLKGVYKNRITRALLVFFLASLGGAIGNFITIPTLMKTLF